MKYGSILLIDDDADDQEIFTTAVAEVSGSVTCDTSSNAEDALQKLNSNELRPDVIFLDLNMPIMSGKDFLIALKSNTKLKTLPVIIFSTTSHKKTITEMKELGAVDFITKPGLYNELVDILKPLLT